MRMLKKLVVILGLFIFISLRLVAKPVSQEDAENVAKNWMYEKKGQKFSILKKSFASSSQKSSSSNVAYRVISLDPFGWVIVSGDDVANPIIAYGTSAMTSGINPAFDSWMMGIRQQIENAKNASRMQTKVLTNRKMDWDKYRVDSTLFKKTRSIKKSRGIYDNDYVVKPLLWEGGSESNEIHWDQDGFYDDYTPMLNGSHTYVGCVAVAMGQIMRFHKYPERGTGFLQYYHYGLDRLIEANFEHQYFWNNMPTSLFGVNDDVSKFLFEVGVSVKMDYGLDASGAYSSFVPHALTEHFNYKSSVLKQRNLYTTAQWHQIIKDELDFGRPLYYAGNGGKSAGHAFVLDGYDRDGFYHFNWGWGGYANGKFLIDDLVPSMGYDYSKNQELVTVVPYNDDNIIKIYDDGLKACVMDALAVSNERDITKERVEGLTKLICKEKNIVDISALALFTNMQDLHLDKNNISDISPLRHLTNLTILSLFINKIEDITALRDLVGLKHLDLYENLIANIAALEDMGSLTFLDLGKNYIRDFSPVNHLAAGVLDGKDTQYSTSYVVDIPDENLRACVMDVLNVESADEIIQVRVSSIKILNCRHRGIENLEGLAYFTTLNDLDLSNNEIVDITPLQSLSSLTHLRLYSNKIQNLSPLKDLTGLIYLDFWNNKVTDIGALKNLNNLLYLDIGKNYISDFTPIDGLADDVVDHKYDQHNMYVEAPSNLTFSNVTQYAVTLQWQDNSANESGFKIFRNGTLIHTTAANVITYHDSGLTENTTYTYTIKATTD